MVTGTVSDKDAKLRQQQTLQSRFANLPEEKNKPRNGGGGGGRF